MVGSRTIIFVFVAPLSKLHQGGRAKTDWLGIGIMCRSGVKYLLVDYCFSELAL